MSDNKTFKYDAFISYRHAELDIYVAENLQRMLESFRVPVLAEKELRKKQKKRINRVFRDKDELPASDNLASPIDQALQESEFLIVICSPRTPESKWVAKEIELFSKYRGREHILAVLIEGEPEVSFPFVLCNGERTVIGENGVEAQESFTIEPLAADVRGASKHEIHKKLKRETMRLAAPILHCGYDDLKQRHKERRLKRIISIATGIASVLLLFGCYATAQNLHIRELQSVALSEQSATAYSDGDRIEGLDLAERALKTRYTPQAQTEITDILQVYDNGEDYLPAASIKHDSDVTDMAANYDCSRILSIDQMGQIYLWDGNSGTLLHKEENMVETVAPGTLQFIGEKMAVYGGMQGLVLFDTEELQSKVLDENIAVSNIAVSNNQNYLLITDGYSVCLYDTSSWEQIYSVPVGEKYDLSVVGAMNVTDDGRYISFGMLDAQSISEYVVMDTKSDQELYHNRLPYDWVEYSRMEQDGSSYVLSKDFSSKGSTEMIGNEQLISYDATGKEQWSYQGKMLMKLPIEVFQDDIVIASNSDLIFIDQKTGIEKTRLGFSSTILKFIMKPDSIDCYLQNGTAFTVTDEEGYFDLQQFFTSAIRNTAEYAESDDRIVIMPDSDIEIMLYHNNIPSNMHQYEPISTYVSDVLLNEDKGKVLTYGYYGNEMLLTKRGTQSDESIHISIGDTDVFSGVYQSMDREHFVIVTSMLVRVYSWEDGSLISEEELGDSVISSQISGDGSVLCIQTFEKLHFMSLADDSKWEIKTVDCETQPYNMTFLNYDGSELIGLDYEMKGTSIHLDSLQETELPWKSVRVAYNKAGKQYLVINDTSGLMELYNEKHELVTSVPKKSSMIQNVGFSKNGKYIFIQKLDATIEIYQSSNLKCKKVLEGITMPIGRLESYGRDKWALYSSETYGGIGYLCNSNFDIIARVPKLYAVNHDGSEMYTGNKEQMLSTKIYTISELRNMGREEKR